MHETILTRYVSWRKIPRTELETHKVTEEEALSLGYTAELLADMACLARRVGHICEYHVYALWTDSIVMVYDQDDQMFYMYTSRLLSQGQEQLVHYNDDGTIYLNGPAPTGLDMAVFMEIVLAASLQVYKMATLPENLEEIIVTMMNRVGILLSERERADEEAAERPPNRGLSVVK